MIKYRLKCKNCENSFDSWFSSSLEFEKLKKNQFLNCHFCNSKKIIKNPMAPNILSLKQNLKNEIKIKKNKNIKIAKIHAKKSDLKINYYCTTPENFNYKEKFDVVLNMEIVEHVEDVNLFLKESSKFLKKNGIMFIATLNKTLKSYFFAILGAEYVLRWLPIGTHDWNMFVKPSELVEICKKNSLMLEEILGVKYNIISRDWELSTDNNVNYMALFKKI